MTYRMKTATTTLTTLALSAFVGMACNRSGSSQPEEATPHHGDSVSSNLDPGATDHESSSIAGAPLDDEDITAAVERELLFDGTTDADAIEVKTTNGVVELSGIAKHLLAKDRATMIAESIRGVRAVSNQLVPNIPERDDERIRDDIREALLLDPTTEFLEVAPFVAEQKVTLKGTVDSWAEKQLAEHVAKSVTGVADVSNDLEIEYRSDRTDIEIEADVLAMLEWDTLVEDSMIKVDVVDGRVTLTGSVGSAAERRQAERHAWVYGAQAVDASGLSVEPYLDDLGQRNRVYQPKPDAEVEEALELAMTLDPRVFSFEVDAKVEHGLATLTGSVDNQLAKEAAERIARHTMGVMVVRNRIDIDPNDLPTDEQIEHDIEWSMVVNPITEAYEIGVEVEKGKVTLTGTVDRYAEAAEAAELALGTAGVAGVTSQIVVEQPEHPLIYFPYGHPYFPYMRTWDVYVPATTHSADDQIEAAIDDQLFWSPFVDGDDVTVSVTHGVATLTGTVQSGYERDAAIANAYEGGAISVLDRLELEKS